MAVRAWMAWRAWMAGTVDGGDGNGGKRIIIGITVKLLSKSLFELCQESLENH